MSEKLRRKPLPFRFLKYICFTKSHICGDTLSQNLKYIFFYFFIFLLVQLNTKEWSQGYFRGYHLSCYFVATSCCGPAQAEPRPQVLPPGAGGPRWSWKAGPRPGLGRAGPRRLPPHTLLVRHSLQVLVMHCLEMV